DGDAPVHGDRMVDRADDGQAPALDFQKAARQSLIVVDDIVVGEAALEVLRQALAKRERLREIAGDVRDVFVDVERSGDFARWERGKSAPSFRTRIEVERRQLNEAHARVEHRIGRTGDDVDAVAEVGERTREVIKIDSLSACQRIAAVARNENTQRTVDA